MAQSIVLSCRTKYSILFSICSSKCFIEWNTHNFYIAFFYQVTINAQYILLIIPDSLLTVYTSNIQSRLSEFEWQDDRSNRCVGVFIFHCQSQLISVLQSEVIRISFRYNELECYGVVHNSITNIIPFCPVIPIFIVFAFTTNQFEINASSFNGTLPYSLFYSTHFIDYFIQ